MEEEEQADRDDRRGVERSRGRTPCRQQGRDDGDDEQGGEERVDVQTAQNVHGTHILIESVC